MGRATTTVLAALVIGGTLGLLLRLCLFLCGALLVRLVGETGSLIWSMGPWLDPVYSHAAQHSLAGLHIRGLAVGGAPGVWLHTSLPQLFVDPATARAGLARVVVEPGSPLLGRMLAATIAHAGVLGIGLLLVRYGWRRRRLALIAAGVAMQLQVALGIIGAQPSLRDLEATGMSFAANALAPWLALRGTAVTDGISGVWPPLVAAMLVAAALAVGYVPSGLLLLLRERGRRFTFATAMLVMLSAAACAGITREEEVSAAPIVGPAPVAARVVPGPRVADRWFDEPLLLSEARAVPSHVEVVGSNYDYQYLVNGQPEVIKGMGLNTQYSSQLSPTERAAQLDSDMQALSVIGVNTVLGWDPAEFDDVLLDAAQRQGIGVVMPFDLDPQADYTNAAFRQALRERVLAWVTRYHAHPALRMWGLGNEVLHKIVHPAWVGPQDPERDRLAVAFSDWLLDTADAMHALDPDHPVTYRSAEDAFVPWVSAALSRRGGGPRPWFVWGTNCYQPYLGDIVDEWPNANLPVALWVSEFAPGGMAVPDRPDGFGRMWTMIRRHPKWVLGGAVYAWTRNGPEGVDRTFGLTDDGQPVDGRSLDALLALFHSD